MEDKIYTHEQIDRSVKRTNRGLLVLIILMACGFVAMLFCGGCKLSTYSGTYKYLDRAKRKQPVPTNAWVIDRYPARLVGSKADTFYKQGEAVKTHGDTAIDIRTQHDSTFITRTINTYFLVRDTAGIIVTNTVADTNSILYWQHKADSLNRVAWQQANKIADQQKKLNKRSLYMWLAFGAIGLFILWKIFGGFVRANTGIKLPS